MAVSTSSKLTLLPGIRDIIQSEAGDALDNNSTVLGILADSSLADGANAAIVAAESVKSGVAEGKMLNYAYPTPAVYTNEGGSNPSFNVLDSYLQSMHSAEVEDDNELRNDIDVQDWRTRGSIGSGTYNSTYFVQSCSLTGADGHIGLDAPSESGGYRNYTGWLKQYYDYSNPFQYFGTLVTGRDGRQLYSPYFSGTTLQWRHRGGYDYIETLGVSSSTYTTWNGGQQSARGMVTYNGRTNTLALIETRSNANAYRVHVWRNANIDLDTEDYTTGDLHNFLSQAKAVGTPTSLDASLYYYYNDFDWQSSNSQNFDESRYRSKIFISDDGTKISMSRMVPQNDFQYAIITLDSAGTSATLVDQKREMGLNNARGVDNGRWYGIRHEITWDNKWAVTYCPYYYYASGMMAFFQSTEDPENYYYASYTNTSWGCQIVPFGKSKFLWNYTGHNIDGNGPRLYPLDPAGFNETGYYASGNAITPGSSFSFTYADGSRYRVDSRYTSTNYAVLFSPTKWTFG